MQEVRQTWAHWDPVLVNKLGPAQDTSVLSIEIEGQPLQPRVRILSPLERTQLDQSLDKWLAQSYIEPSNGWVTCNPLFVEKKDGSLRTCIDYRPINSVTKVWEWALPRIRDIRHQLRGNSWFTRLDLKEAFHRITVLPHCRALTAFHTHRGVFQFTRMPFGLCTAPATYQRFIDWILAPAREHTIRYVDDVLVLGQTRRQCELRTAHVERLLRHHQVLINNDKSERLVRKTTFVGLTVHGGGIGAALPVEGWPLPITKPEWQSAMGYANCFRDYVPDFASMSCGLYPAKDNPPMEVRHERWRLLWAAVARHVTLSHYSDDQPGQLYLDASQYAVGAVLMQANKVCAIFSKGLNGAQSRYSATDREHLALLLGTEAFRVFLQGSPMIQVNTDHTALLNRNEERLTHRQFRWKIRIQSITTNIKHVSGSLNPADYWSRQGWKGGGDKFYA